MREIRLAVWVAVMPEVVKWKVVIRAFALVFLMSCVFYSDYIVGGALPITSADPAIHYWARLGNAKHLKNHIVPLWDRDAGLGRSIFQNDLWKSPFHGGALSLMAFEKEELGHVCFLWIQTVLFGLLMLFYWERHLKLDWMTGTLAVGILLFIPGFLNEYFYNAFGGYIFVPLMVIQVNKYVSSHRTKYAFFLGFLLALSHWIGNFSVPQFCWVFLGLYALYIVWHRPNRLASVLSLFRFFAVGALVWIGLLGFYILPFLIENLSQIRSHSYAVGGGIDFGRIILSFVAPVTSQMFIDEKIIPTGFVTYLESLPLYVHVLLLPSLAIFLANRQKFSRGERFFFYYVICFLVLGWSNKFVPLLGYLTKATRGTGWWRSMPLFFVCGSVCVALVVSRLHSGEICGRSTRLGTPISVFVKSLSAFYALAFLGVALLFAVSKTANINAVYSVLGRMTPRPAAHIAEYMERYYFVWPRFGFIMLVLLSLSFSLYAFDRLLVGEKRPCGARGFLGALLITILFGQYSLTKLYYPFNNGIRKTMTLDTNNLLKAMGPTDRVGIVFNPQSEIEEAVRKEMGYSGIFPNLSLSLALQEYPEFARVQSNITMFGAYIGSLGIGCYTTGANFLSRRMIEFHDSVIRDDERIAHAFVRQKAYLQLSERNVDSKLLDVAGIDYILSSRPLESEKLSLIGYGGGFHIYKNASAVPKFYLVRDIEFLKKDQEALDVLLSDDFDVGREAVVEGSFNWETVIGGDSSIDILKYTPNSIVLVVKNENKGFLVVNDACHKGWIAVVNGRKSELYRTNHIFRGVLLEPGTNRVEMHFNPPGFRHGVIISLVTLITMVIYLAVFGR